MKKTLLLSLVMVVSAGLMACKPSNPKLVGEMKPATPLEPIRIQPEVVEQNPLPPDAKEHDRYLQDDELTMKYNPKVDILFVMDTSQSMACDQTKLRSNINKFVDVFTKNQGRFLDFHIGVVSVWDSITYGNSQRTCELGELRPLGGSAGPARGKCADNGNNITYVTRETPDLAKTLGDTLKVGIEEYNEDPLKSGPEHEELLSPILAAIAPESAAMNFNFRRANEAHLAVIVVSDTDDLSPNLSASTMARTLKGLSSDNISVSTYAVLARYDDLLKFEQDPVANPLREYPRAGMNECSVNPVDPLIRPAGQAPRKMREFLVQSGGTGFDLKDPDYGNKLGAIGESIVRKSLRKVINLHYVPDLTQSIVVKYGATQEIPKSDLSGWSYDPGRQTITINEGVVLQPEENARITIEYTPVRVR